MQANHQKMSFVSKAERTRWLRSRETESTRYINTTAASPKNIMMTGFAILILASAAVPPAQGFHANGSQHRHHHQSSHHDKHNHTLPEVRFRGDVAANRTATMGLHHHYASGESAVHHSNWRRLEMMDSNGLYWLEWWLQGKRIHMRVTANTEGYIGLGFSRKTGRSAGADLVLLWVDNHTGKPNALVNIHMIPNFSLIFYINPFAKIALTIIIIITLLKGCLIHINSMIYIKWEVVVSQPSTNIIFHIYYWFYYIIIIFFMLFYLWIW